MHGVHTDVLRSKLDSGVLCESAGAALGCAVGGVNAVGVARGEAADGVDVDDGSLPGLLHIRLDSLDGKEHGKAVGFENVQELFLRCVKDDIDPIVSIPEIGPSQDEQHRSRQIEALSFSILHNCASQGVWYYETILSYPDEEPGDRDGCRLARTHRG